MTQLFETEEKFVRLNHTGNHTGNHVNRRKTLSLKLKVQSNLGSRTPRITNKFSELKASRMTYCVSSYEHASRQNEDKNKSHWTTF